MADHPTVQAALAAVMDDVRAVRKENRNADQGYMFRGIDAVTNAVGPALRKHGVVVLPELVDKAYRDVTTSKGKPAREVTVTVRYTFVGPDGGTLQCTVPGEAMDWGDKGTPKAMSVAMRTALLQALCLPTDDADPDAESYERAEEAQPDPRRALQHQIKDKSVELGWTPEEVIADFAARTNGKDIREGSEEELTAYLKWFIDQPSKWDRQPAGES